ncbi:MAG: transporter substrate-binding domain-containing protein [Campylobacteraceae bacterium]|nr:transporter substrate-binding domain-containing protein [Campylobacteraceae bacterium]
MKHFFYLLLFLSTLFAGHSQEALPKMHFSLQQQEFIKTHPIIKVSNETNWAPFDYNEEGTAKGYSVDYLKLLAKKIGVTFVFETDTWTNLIQKIKDKKIDLIHPLSINPKRTNFLNFTDVLFDNDLSLVTNVENYNIKSLKDLNGKKLSVVKGWNSTRILKENFPYIQFKEYDNALDKLKAVSFGEVDATVDAYLTINFLKQKHLLNNLKIVGHVTLPFYNSHLYIGVRKDWHILTDILNITMAHITNEDLISLNQKWMISIEKKINFTEEELNFLKIKKQINLCVDPSWMPYEKIENNVHVGIFADYFKIFKDELPIPIHLVQTSSWAQTLEFAKSRKCDIISAAAQTPKRSIYLDFPKPYIAFPLVVATKPDKPFVASILDVLPYEIAVVKEYAYIELLKDKYPTIKLVEVDSIDIGFEKILKGEVYGFIDSLTIVGTKIQKDYLERIKIAGKIDEEFHMGVATRKDMPLLKSIFDKVVDGLSPTQHSTILNNWVSVEYNKSFDYSTLWKVLVFILFLTAFFLYRQFILKKQNLALQEAVNEFEQLINSTMEAMFILDNGTCIDCNTEAVKLLGYKDKKEIIGLHALEVIDFRHHELVKQNLNQDSSEPYEVNALKKDGSLFPVLIRGHSFYRKNKKIRISAMLDLTQLKQKERVITENAKMVALGEMMANIAHQWRQPLSVVSTAASGVKVQKEMNILTDTLFYESMDAIVKNANYLSKTIDDFSSFIKDDKKKQAFYLKEHIDKNLGILSGTFKINHINLILDINSKIELITFENELTQAFINIINNAKDILNEKNIEDKFIFIKTYQDKNKVYLSIKDNAGGIPDSIINRVFEPYFTTKDKQQGTGLGLYMVRQIIVESMQGEILVQNVQFKHLGKTYKGAEFIISL